MKTDIIRLNNNFTLKLLNNFNNLPTYATNIKNLKLINILKEKVFMLKIDFKSLNIKEYKKILRKLLLYKILLLKTKINIGIMENSKILLGYIINYDENNKEHKEFILAINAIFFANKYERYNYIYDTVCNYLDSYFYGKNLCVKYLL